MARLVRAGPRRTPDCRAESRRIKLGRVGRQADLDIAQALAPSQWCERHRAEWVCTRQGGAGHRSASEQRHGGGNQGLKNHEGSSSRPDAGPSCSLPAAISRPPWRPAARRSLREARSGAAVQASNGTRSSAKRGWGERRGEVFLDRVSMLVQPPGRGCRKSLQLDLRPTCSAS